MSGAKTHLTVMFIFNISKQHLIIPVDTHIELYTASYI